jgi:hypothetical protein
VSNLYQGALAPEAYVMNLTPGDSGLDLSTVTDADLIVSKPDGTVETWAPVMSNQTATTLTLTFEFDATDSEVDVPDEYIIYAKLTIPSGTMTSERVRRRVIPRFSVQ